MSSITFLKGLAHHLVEARGLRLARALQEAARLEGFATWEAARATLPELERSLADGDAVQLRHHRLGMNMRLRGDRIRLTTQCIEIQSGRYRGLIPCTVNPRHLIAHCSWLLGVNVAAAFGAEADLLDSISDVYAGKTAALAVRRAALDKALDRFVTGQGLPELGEERWAANRQATAAICSEAVRRHVICRRNVGEGQSDIEVKGTVTTPWSSPAHSPTGPDWHFPGAAAASLAVNILNAFVPPYWDGLEAQPWRAGGASATATSSYADFYPQVLALPARGGALKAQAVAEFLRTRLQSPQQAPSKLPEVLRCADDLKYFNFGAYLSARDPAAHEAHLEKLFGDAWSTGIGADPGALR